MVHILLLFLLPVLGTSSAVHPARLREIEATNSDPNATWTAAAHPRFAAEAPGASKPLCGLQGSWQADVQRAIAAGDVEEFVVDLTLATPDSFDSAEQWPDCAKIIGDIRDQSNCGCCWAFAGAEAASDRMCIATNATIQLPLSAQDVCFGTGIGGCHGGAITTPWTYIGGLKGAVTGGQYNGTGPYGAGFCQSFTLPHCHHHGPQGKDPYPAEGQPGCPKQKSPRHSTSCDATAEAPHADYDSDKYTFSGRTQSASGVEAVKQMILAGGPVETGFTVYSDFENYQSGVYQNTGGSSVGGHAVKIVGWGTDGGVDYWKVANSWNPYWGEAGYFRIKQGDCFIDDRVVGSHADAKWGKKSAFL